LADDLCPGEKAKISGNNEKIGRITRGRPMMTNIYRGLLTCLATLIMVIGPLSVAWSQTGAAASPEVVKWAYMAAAIAAGLGVLGAGVAVMGVGAAAMGAISEKPELFARALIFVGLAEGLAIYGLIVAIMILGRV
jgi:V/A-type H+/Na+-transporting ATPase subunit K